MTSTVNYEGNLRTKTTHMYSGNSIITDAPIDNNGKAEAFSPTDLVATALGSCMMTIMGIYARNNNIVLDNTRLEVTKIMASDPRRISEVHIIFYIPNSNVLDDITRKKLEHAALHCPVAKSLHSDIQQVVQFIYE
jgi:putative redox protein